MQNAVFNKRENTGAIFTICLRRRSCPQFKQNHLRIPATALATAAKVEEISLQLRLLDLPLHAFKPYRHISKNYSDSAYNYNQGSHSEEIGCTNRGQCPFELARAVCPKNICARHVPFVCRDSAENVPCVKFMRGDQLFKRFGCVRVYARSCTYERTGCVYVIPDLPRIG